MTGADIVESREAVGFKQVPYAQRLGIHPITLSRFENNHDPIPLYIQLAVCELERRLRAEGYPKKTATRSKKGKPKK